MSNNETGGAELDMSEFEALLEDEDSLAILFPKPDAPDAPKVFSPKQRKRFYVITGCMVIGVIVYGFGYDLLVTFFH